MCGGRAGRRDRRERFRRAVPKSASEPRPKGAVFNMTINRADFCWIAKVSGEYRLDPVRETIGYYEQALVIAPPKLRTVVTKAPYCSGIRWAFDIRWHTADIRPAGG